MLQRTLQTGTGYSECRHYNTTI